LISRWLIAASRDSFRRLARYFAAASQLIQMPPFAIIIDYCHYCCQSLMLSLFAMIISLILFDADID
jgi:hypothetical protein